LTQNRSWIRWLRYFLDVKSFWDNIHPTLLPPYNVTIQRIWTKSERVDVDSYFNTAWFSDGCPLKLDEKKCFFNTQSFEHWGIGNTPRVPGFSWGIFSHAFRFNQSLARDHWWILKLILFKYLSYLFLNLASVVTYLFFFQASERAGILNPPIWLANNSLVTVPAFYDTGHGPHFFPRLRLLDFVLKSFR